MTVEQIALLTDPKGWLKSDMVRYGIGDCYFETIVKDSTMLTPRPGHTNFLVQDVIGSLWKGHRRGNILGDNPEVIRPFLKEQSVNDGSPPLQNFNEEMLMHNMVISPQNVHQCHYIAVCMVHSNLIAAPHHPMQSPYVIVMDSLRTSEAEDRKHGQMVAW
jgi:hypothetical protein